MNEDHVYQVYYGKEGSDATRLLTRARIHWIVDQVPDGRILDVGCSQGVTSVLLAERGATVVGIDNEAPAIEFAEKVRIGLDAEVQERLRFVEADAEDIPFALKSFDHIICSEVLEHVENPNKIVEDMFRVLRPGGLIVVTVPFGVMPHPDHKRAFYPESVAALLDPLFTIQETNLLDRHIAVVGKRRQRAKGGPSYGLGDTESAFLEREEDLREQVGDLSEKLSEANVKYRNATTVGAKYRDRLSTTKQALEVAEGQAREAGKTAASLKQQLEGLEKRALGLEKELAQDRSRAAELEKRAQALEVQRDASRREHSIAAEKLAAAEGAEAQVKASQASEQEARERMGELERAATAADRELAGHQAVSSLLRERVSELKTDADAARRELQEARQEQTETRARLLDLERSATAAKIELDTARAESQTQVSAREKQVSELEVQVETLRAELAGAEEALGESREEARALRGKVAELEGKTEAGRDQLEAAMEELKASRGAERKQLRERRETRRSRTAEHLDRLLGLAGEQGAALDQIEGKLPDIRENLDRAEAIGRRSRRGEIVSPSISRPIRPREADEFDRWCERAAAAPGDEVVFMYSGTIYVQEKRGNRPIRLTRVYLDQDRPVFFNYWRWKTDEPAPDFTHPLLFQSPVDITPKLLDRLLEADFGGKRKMMFASFPHELMIRSLSRGAQQGWVTIYDARDDWEEFEKVGMAKWYDLGFEEYLVRHADVVTAVSLPLARKLGEMGNRSDIEIVPNALDSNFPDPPGPREVSDPPIVGYFGHLTPKWFDWDLIIRAAREHPDWSFELAGHQEPEDLKLPENVSLLGLLGHTELASLSRRWSFAIIPFKVSALGEAVDPIKVYEYLHLGLPVLSSYMPQMRDYPATVIAESSEDFLALLPSMTRMTLDMDVVRPWLEENRWEDRIDRFSRLADLAEDRNRESRDLKSLLHQSSRASDAARLGAGDAGAV